MEESMCYYLFPTTMSLFGLSMLFVVKKALRETPTKMENELAFLENKQDNSTSHNLADYQH